MLYLISLGLCDEKDMSLRALETAKKCDSLYVEFYTTRMFTTAAKLGRLVGKPVRELQRSGLEEESGRLIKEARTKDVCVFVGGDALTATTHISLLAEARKAGVRTKVTHGSSIYTAIASTGLQIYKFGKTTTLALPEKGYRPTSCYDAIKDNKKRGLHTLVLLDVKSDKGKYMNVPEACGILLELEAEIKGGILTKETRAVAACMLGSDGQAIRYGQLGSLAKDKSLSPKTPAVVIIPGELHFMEEEYLKLVSKQA
jgi:diphthine synthase